MIKYGLISETDARTLEKTIDLVFEQFKYNVVDHFVCVTEVGCYSGDSGRGLFEYIKSKNRIPVITGIDNFRDQQPISKDFSYDNFIQGNSSEVYNQLPDESQHICFIDGCHTFPAVVADFFCYSPKVKVGGFLAFHDTGKHINPLHGWQGVGDKNDPDFCLGGVRKALNKIGLFDTHNYGHGMLEEWVGENGFELVFDEADPTDDAGGICCFKKLY